MTTRTENFVGRIQNAKSRKTGLAVMAQFTFW